MIQSHKQDFEQIYSSLPYRDLANVRFPLAEIEAFDWKRGRWLNEYYNYFYRRFSSHILSRLSLGPDQSILVVGCGFGLDEKNIRNIYDDADLWSIDISEEMLRRAIANQSPSHFALGIAEKLPFPDNSFDRVLSREVIEHVMSPAIMLKEISRVLKPGGIAVITTENDESLGPTNYFDSFIKEKISALLHYPLTSIPYKDVAPQLEQMQAMVKDAGLIMVEYFYDGALYQYLIEQRGILKTNLSRVAHYFSCLENKHKLAFAFCDQVKYVVVKDTKSTFHKKKSLVYYTCINCYAKLTRYDQDYKCSKCGQQYSVIDGFPIFLPNQMPEERKFYSIPANSSGLLNKYIARIFPGIVKVLRSLYCGFYMLIAFSSTLFIKKNNVRISHILSEGDPYQKYLKDH